MLGTGKRSACPAAGAELVGSGLALIDTWALRLTLLQPPFPMALRQNTLNSLYAHDSFVRESPGMDWEHRVLIVSELIRVLGIGRAEDSILAERRQEDGLQRVLMEVGVILA